MSDNPPSEPTPPAEAGTPNTVTNRDGGVDFNVQGNVTINGPVAGRDLYVHAGASRDKNLRILMEKVKTFWVEGVLENSVHHAALIELGKQVKADAVQADHPWATVVRIPNKPEYTLPPEAKIIDVFDEMQGALLILGEPGSGKTTTLLELARDLITRAEKDSTLPVPVVLNLSSWGGETAVHGSRITT